MKSEVLQLVQKETDPAQKLNLLREYLQALALRSLHESEAFSNLAFVGGTALRFAYGLQRFSEDLDFSLEVADGYEPERWLKKLKNDLMLASFDVSLTWSNKTNIHKSWIRCGGLLKEAGLSPHAEQKLSIKLEIDTTPPDGAICQKQIVNRYRMLALNLHDLPSLMAGKIHALITRNYPKGRDWYDLLWYCSRRPKVEPNLTQLHNALIQTQGKGVCSAGDWRSGCLTRIRQLDISELVADVKPFLEHPDDAEMLNINHFETILLTT
jgi:predicted nucleotidyltransferase component of viral defense system